MEILAAAVIFTIVIAYLVVRIVVFVKAVRRKKDK
jgi:hypothetical protein